MDHDLPEWFDLDGRLAGLQQIPVMLQFRPVDLRPCLDEPLLRLWQASARALNRVHREHSRLVLVVRVEMRSVVLRAGFDEHTDNDPEEPRKLARMYLTSSALLLSG
jgi:hypothetical protein